MSDHHTNHVPPSSRRPHRRRGVVALATTVAVGVAVLAIASPAAAHRTGGYRNESTAAEDNSDWMADLPAGLRISQLSLPGTHDTGAYKYGGESVETQSMDVAEQLKAGIRVWDMRLGIQDESSDDALPLCTGPELWTFHGFVCQHETFSGDILPAAKRFLQDHPGETILMRVKHEHGDIDDFASDVEAEMDRFPGLFYAGSDANPALGEIRGKVVLLRDYDDSTRGIEWGQNMKIQDEYDVDTNWDLADKWADVKDQFKAADDTSRMDTTYVNFLSASGGSFPYFIASGHSSWETGAPQLLTGWTDGVIDTCQYSDQCIREYPRVNCLSVPFVGKTCSVAFEGVDIMAEDYIDESVQHRVGIVMADFPGPGLIREIIELNPWNTPPVPNAGGPYSTTENTAITFDASGSTDPNGDGLTYSWDFNGDGSFEVRSSTSPTAQHTFTDDFTGTATVQVSDGFTTASATAAVTVSNVAPTISAIAVDVDENGTTTATGTITDPSPDDTFTVTIDWADGAVESRKLPAGASHYTASHQYLDDDPTGTAVDSYAISVGIADDNGGTGSATDVLDVSNVSPVVSVDSVTDESGAQVGAGTRLSITDTRVDVEASFTDVGTVDSHTASVDWGDGTVDELGSATGTTGSSHVYAVVGDYTVSVTVTDDDGGADSQSRDLTVTDAAGAFAATADALRVLADDPTLPGNEHVQRAVDWLIGNNGGDAANGALDLLEKGNLNAALGKVVKALEALEAAEAAGAPDLSAHQSLLALGAKSVAVSATDQAAASRDHIDAGTSHLLTGQYVDAVEEFQLAVRAN